MICKRCNIEMKLGQAIHTDRDPPRNVCFGFGNIREKHPLKIVQCWKCPKCGHSEDIE